MRQLTSASIKKSILLELTIGAIRHDVGKLAHFSVSTLAVLEENAGGGLAVAP